MECPLDPPASEQDNFPLDQGSSPSLSLLDPPGSEQDNFPLGGQWPMEYQSFPIFFFVASLCSFICLQAVYQLSGAVCKATWNGYPSYSLLTFISRFVD